MISLLKKLSGLKKVARTSRTSPDKVTVDAFEGGKVAFIKASRVLPGVCQTRVIAPAGIGYELKFLSFQFFANR